MFDFINILIGGEQKNQAVKTDGVCTCLCSSMGTGGGYIPLIVLAQNTEHRTQNNTDSERLCQHSVCRKYSAAESRSGRKCLLQSGCKSNIKSKGLQRSAVDFRKIKNIKGVDLCYIESRIVDISACICVRYDAGICRHKLEHTGVLVEYE